MSDEARSTTAAAPLMASTHAESWTEVVDRERHTGSPLMSEMRLEWALAQTVPAPGCAVCSILRDDEEQFWDGFLYESFQDPDAPRTVEASLGYCRRHLDQLEQRQDVVPAATMALGAVRGALGRLERPSSGRGLFRRSPEPAPPGTRCPLCVRLAGTQRHAIAELVAQLDRQPELAEQYAASDGLCVDHLLEAEDPKVLARPTERALGEVSEALERLLESFDYRNPPADPELVDAWRRAFRLIRDEPGAIRVP